MIKELKRRFKFWLTSILLIPSSECVAAWTSYTEDGTSCGCELRDCDDCPCIIAIFPKWFTKLLVRRQRRKEDARIEKLRKIIKDNLSH